MSNATWQQCWQGWYKSVDGNRLLLRKVILGDLTNGYVGYINGTMTDIRGRARNIVSLRREMDSRVLTK